MFKPSLFTLSVVLVVTTVLPAIAVPARLFTPHLEDIRRGLPEGWLMRLPSEEILGTVIPPGMDVIVKAFPSRTPPGLTVSLLTCETGAMPCLLGTMVVEVATSPNAKVNLDRHKAAANPITLNRRLGIRGYLLPNINQSTSNPFSSVAWEQNGMVYTVSLPAAARQTVLDIAHSMANSVPIESWAEDPAANVVRSPQPRVPIAPAYSPGAVRSAPTTIPTEPAGKNPLFY